MSAVSAAAKKRFDVVVWGCTGFTGKLTCEYLSKQYVNTGLKWAIAGRNMEAMESIKQSLKLPDTVEIITGSLSDPMSLRAIASQTKVVLSTAGPYAKIGTPMIEACLAGEAHYCDLTGEAPWIRTITDKYFDEAKNKKLKLVNCCGYDCIPCDLGAQMIVDEIQRRGLIAQEVRFAAGPSKGGVSGGTLASVYNILESQPMGELMKLASPFYLNPRISPSSTSATGINNNSSGEEGSPVDMPYEKGSKLYAAASDNMLPGYDDVAKKWTMPYFMQGIDLRLVNRSNAISGFSYGRSFLFTERMLVPNAAIAFIGSGVMLLVQLLLVVPFTRFFLKKLLPKPGEGPDQDTLDNGFFTAVMWGKAKNPTSGEVEVIKGTIEAYQGDPGYRQTAKMIAESAVCLALDGEKLPDTFGILTPSVAMGTILRNRLFEKGLKIYLGEKQKN
mmetsp:Transcript_9726/g.16065  ORF Transcript_9726/g.16065 Transcript_9726/m.16065 type:complete len:445 (-) Transcript_9726:771-2105(-)